MRSPRSRKQDQVFRRILGDRCALGGRALCRLGFAENQHGDGILRRSTVPCSDWVAVQLGEAREAAIRIAEALDHVGVLTVEFFASRDGPLVNEIAPRVHNSGHWTIEGAVTSQFEQHIRAICDLPPGRPTRSWRGDGQPHR